MSSLSPSINMPGNFINDYITDSVTGNPFLVVLVIVILLGYYYLLSGLEVGRMGSKEVESLSESITSVASSSSSGMSFIEIVFWGLLLFLVVINGVQFFFSLDLKTELRNLFWGNPELDITVRSSQLPETKRTSLRKEVFHIPERFLIDALILLGRLALVVGGVLAYFLH